MAGSYRALLSRELRIPFQLSVRTIGGERLRRIFGALQKNPYPNDFTELQKRMTVITAQDQLEPEQIPSLEQRLTCMQDPDPEVSALVDIGLPQETPNKRREVVRLDPDRKQKLLNAALSKTLEIDLHQVRRSWADSGGMQRATFQAANYYGVYKDLFKHGYFIPRVSLSIVYPYDNELVTPVHRGNLLTASEASRVPEVSYDSGPDDMWTLVLTNLDGHFNDNEAEYIHWFIANIKGQDLSTGEEVIPYLQPFPPRGTGYHRMVFVLYKQDGKINFENPRKVTHRYNLKERTFKTFDFYKTYQDAITPAGLAFFQAIWDDTLTDFFHNVLDMREPVYEYDQKPLRVDPQVEFPELKPFNRYLDLYRDKKEMRAEVLLKRLKTLDPLKEEPPMPRFPNIHFDRSVPSWKYYEQWMENNRIGRFRDLRPHSIYEQPEFDFKKDMYNKRAGDETGS